LLAYLFFILSFKRMFSGKKLFDASIVAIYIPESAFLLSKVFIVLLSVHRNETDFGPFKILWLRTKDLAGKPCKPTLKKLSLTVGEW